jgi:uncharacterized protein (DUF924 family)
MSSLSSAQPEIDRIIQYWFNRGDEPILVSNSRWFAGGDKVDAEIKDQFGTLVQKARASQLESWTQDPNATIALIILLDQFSRNLFRGSPLSYSKDSMALDIATKAIAQGFDRKVTPVQQLFFYFPLVHDEKLISHVAANALYDGWLARNDCDQEIMEYAQRVKDGCKLHTDIILRFGRYPSRNKILGRESTPEEIEYLKTHPTGF